MLLRAQNKQAGAPPVRIFILGSVEHNFFTNGSVELFDCAGRADRRLLPWRRPDRRPREHQSRRGRRVSTVRTALAGLVRVRLPLLHRAPRHSVPGGARPRVFVQKVDFTSAPGTSPEGVHRTGGPVALVTGKALFGFDRTLPGFTLESLHPGHDLAEVVNATGFAFAHTDRPKETAARPGDRRAPSGAGYERAIRDLPRIRRPDAAGTCVKTPSASPPAPRKRTGQMNDRSGSLADIKVVDAEPRAGWTLYRADPRRPWRRRYQDRAAGRG